ncbi:MAG: transposase [Chloroflexi bacterium]|nr:transposase [Chloroflexota bacterium]
MNLFLTRLDEQQRRWYVALESKRVAHGGDLLLSRVTGMNVETIRQGRRELENDLADRPSDRVRLTRVGDPQLKKRSRATGQFAD